MTSRYVNFVDDVTPTTNMPTRIDNSDSPDNVFIDVDDESAARLGCRGGRVPNSSASTQRIFDRWTATRALLSPVTLAGAVEVFDFTESYDANRTLKAPYGIGRYDEDRRGMYNSQLFTREHEPRTIHVGLDIGASEGTPVFAPLESSVWGHAYLSEPGDYGGTIILKSFIPEQGLAIFMLFGHLSKLSTLRFETGAEVRQGELLSWFGGARENGGWKPHLHWQLSFLEPLKVDLPGVVSKKNHELAKLVFPNPTELLRGALNGWS